mmetsp:Transcript_61239/g.165225  ORF Transcript_61239/g.165225 Transcript_61239/m.165225 type:complete len:214 (+) Transcript_61239:442-1083(+)
MTDAPQLSDSTASGSCSAQSLTNSFALSGERSAPGPASTSAFSQRWPPSLRAASISRRYLIVGSTQSKCLKSSLMPLRTRLVWELAEEWSLRDPTHAVSTRPFTLAWSSSSLVRSLANATASSLALPIGSTSSTGWRRRDAIGWPAPAPREGPPSVAPETDEDAPPVGVASQSTTSSANQMSCWSLPESSRSLWRSTALTKRSRLRSLDPSVG